jgi:predicted nucleic acid-binding protein
MILVDSCVLLDLIDNDQVWKEWSAGQIIKRSIIEDLFLNPIVYAEISVRYGNEEDVDRILVASGLGFMGIPRRAAFLAAKAYQQYRQLGGQRSSLLPDFFIGAHAEVLGATILTRDTRRYATYFPAVPLIAP